jgi:CxxC motif-containing protein (DUF1111 family)
MNKSYYILFTLVPLAIACTNNGQAPKTIESDAKYVGKAVGNFTAEEWYTGGQLGTTLNVTEGCYEDPTPAVDAQGLTTQFNMGEHFFERNYSEYQKPFNGLGPASVRKSCLDCHPGYGHGQWQQSYVANGAKSMGNGYLLVVYYANADNDNDGPYVRHVTGMPQTMAQAPFLPPIDETKIQLTWTEIAAMESGLPTRFADGEEYHLQYPTLYIPQDAFNTVPTPYDEIPAGSAGVGFRLESTIGVIGTGLIDAIDQEDIREQYRAEAPYVELNASFWDAGANDFAASAYYHNWQSGTVPIYGQEGVYCGDGYDAEGNFIPRDTYRNGKLLKKFTYAMTRGTLQDGAGANAIWNITNVSRPDRPFLYTTEPWAKAMSQNASVIAAIRAEGAASPYYVDVDKNGTVTDAEIAETVYELLKPTTNQFDNPYHNFEPEMTEDQFYAFMVWHRGLAIPRARDLQDPAVQKGKKLFNEMGCATCHRPSWKTREDNYWAPALNGKKKLPRYANQTIWPYSDFIQHRLWMKNDIHGTWCRTTPLWGRGLSVMHTGSSDRLHDCRARTVVEAIMWHAYSRKSDAYSSAEKFYNLSKEDRDAVVRFIESI